MKGDRTDGRPVMSPAQTKSRAEHTTTSGSAEPPSSILIVGFCSGEVFTASEVLICAETLCGEQAIRAWLAGHGIHLAIRANA